VEATESSPSNQDKLHFSTGYFTGPLLNVSKVGQDRIWDFCIRIP
jgi:hypothetical protein